MATEKPKCVECGETEDNPIHIDKDATPYSPPSMPTVKFHHFKPPPPPKTP